MPAWGGGIGISAVGAKAKAMGGAYRAIADDWSAAYYNPAGLFYTTESQISFNEVISHNRNTYTPDVHYGDYKVGFYEGEIYSDYKVLTNPTLGGFFKLPIGGKDIVAGLSIFQPFDNNISWELYQSLNNAGSLPGQQIEHNYDATAINLVAAFELVENRLSLGLSAGAMKSDLVFANFFLRPNPLSEDTSYYDQVASRPNDLITEWQKSDGYGYSPNLRAGMLFKVTPKLNIGVTYAIKSTVTVDGDTYLYYFMPDNFFYHSYAEDKEPSSMGYILSSGARYEGAAEFETEITLPAQVGGGLAYQLTDKLLVSGDLEYTLWSDFTGYYLDYTFKDSAITLNPLMNQRMVEDMNVPVDWDDALKGSIGLQYQYSDVVHLRAGYMADQTPVNEGTLNPAFFDSGLKNTFSLGLGLKYESIILDFATGYTDYPESYESTNVDIESEGVTDGIVDNMPGTYGGGTFESIVQLTVRF
jgi:long-chain fatty acid transport protein